MNTLEELESTWQGMLKRCYDERYSRYSDYGGRGIGVCDRWHDFDNFVDDMGPKLPGTTLDRVNNDGNYEPDNCRWATSRQQALNRRIRRDNTTGYRGVKLTEVGTYFTSISAEGTSFYIGTYKTAEEAAWMYDQWAISLNGDDARLNLEYRHLELSTVARMSNR